MQNFRYYNLKLFAQEFVNDIRYVRMRNINFKYDTYIYYGENEIASYVLRQGGKDIKEVFLKSNMIIQYSNNKIIFKNTGMFNGNGETIKIIDNETKKEIIITIVPFSGRVLERIGEYE